MKPGGWIELQEMCGVPQCDDGTMQPDDGLANFVDMIGQALDAHDLDVNKCRAMRGPLRRAGFTNIQLVKKKSPLGGWHADPALEYIGEYQKQVVYDVLGPITARPLEAIGINATERAVWAATARKAMDDESVHRYFWWYFWIAQKPVEAEGRKEDGRL